MAKYIIKRILAAIPMVLIITVICFALMNLAPYDAIDAMTTPNMSPETVALIKAKYGYDQPVYIQYIRWLDGLINGNFGYSIVTHQSISADLAIRIPNTIKLILPAYLMAYALAIVLGLIAFSFGTAAGVLCGKVMYKLTGGQVNPLIGSAGVSAVPMAARVSQKVGQSENPSNFLLMHAMGPNVAGVIGSAVAAGILINIFG